ncbi:tetratricopeptide repeat protein [Nocardioides sp.]|uniref:tetratricopeptide repeat protein n=1 Tax=Nocardioides sp. TaxID=35761 RepID=UPI002D0DAE8F|nr:tetratricopeptide repeat protein [Nocardioides sp.]HXH80969.1 tetratricopeptide repeat protein [Nocardioides sp.]
MSDAATTDVAAPPSPVGAQTLDELTRRLVALRAWAGDPSYAEIARTIGADRSAGTRPNRTAPGKVTIYDCFRLGRRRVDIELLVDIVGALGAEPHMSEWRQAHRAILLGRAAARLVRVYDHLPPTTDPFVGRADELRLLGETEQVSLIVGMPGVGKTELALHAAHGEAAGYDACFYVNLRGYSVEHQPADPAAVLESLLRQLDVTPSVIHGATLMRRSALLAEVATRLRLLLVIDNAREADQVLPLLPGGSARVLITSRRALALPDAQQVNLAPLSAAHSLELLSVASGTELPPDPATRRLVDLCGHLPLHLRVVAAHLANTPTWSMQDQVRRLESTPPERAVRAALDASYAGLQPAEQRLLRLLALHPGHDVSTQAAAALADVDVAEARRLIDGLVHEHLLEHEHGMHRLHDVIRAYATALGVEKDPRSDQVAALERLLTHYRRWTACAVRHIRPDEITAPESDEIDGPELFGVEAARRWLVAECENVVATAWEAGMLGFVDELAVLADILQAWLEADVRFGEMETLYRAMTESSSAVHQRDGARHLGRVFDMTGRLDDALRWSQKAVELDPDGDDIASRNQLGNILLRHGRVEEASESFELALDVARRTGNRFREGRGLGNLSSVSTFLGQLELAESQLREAMEISATEGDLENVSITATNLSGVLTTVSRYDEAVEALQQSIDIDQQLGLRLQVPGSMRRMAFIRAQQGHTDDALTLLGAAIDSSTALGLPVCVGESLTIRGEIHLGAGAPSVAQTDFRRALRIGEETGSTWVILDATMGLAHVCLHRGESDEARPLFAAALEKARTTGAPEMIERARAGLAACGPPEA